MVVTNKAHYAERLRSLRNLCFRPDRRFLHTEIGHNYRMSNILAAIGPYDFQHSLTPKNLFTLRPTAVQMEALVWIRNHVQHDAVIIINPNLYTDLHEEGGDGVGEGATYPYANVYWNVALDPEEHETLLKGNWDRIDYIVADSEMLNDIKTYGGQMMIIDESLYHSTRDIAYNGSCSGVLLPALAKSMA